VEISAPPIEPHRSRTATFVVACLAAFLLLLFVILFGGGLSRTSSAGAKSPTGKKRAVGRAEPRRARLSRAETKILVLNANGISGAAAAESDRLVARGYKVSGTGNAAQTYGQSVVLYRPGRLPEAKRLAADEGIPLVGPLDGLTPRQLHGAHLAIVLGN
jgi:hypothetical protein